MVWPPSGNRFSEIVRDIFEDTLDFHYRQDARYRRQQGFDDMMTRSRRALRDTGAVSRF